MITNRVDSQASNLDNYRDDLLFAKDLKAGLESFIKLGLKKNGITILQNAYTGFDTEYQYKEDIYLNIIQLTPIETVGANLS